MGPGTPPSGTLACSRATMLVPRSSSIRRSTPTTHPRLTDMLRRGRLLLLRRTLGGSLAAACATCGRAAPQDAMASGRGCIRLTVHLEL